MREALVCVLASVGMLAACGSASQASPTHSPSPGASSSTVVAASQPAGSITVLMANLRFTPSALQVRAGRFVFYLVVPGSETVAHNMVIEDQTGNFLVSSASIKPDQNAVFTVFNLPPGNYKFISGLDMNGYSDVSQAEMGMVGTLTVIP